MNELIVLWKENSMKCKVSNWMVLTVSNNKTFVTRGYHITKKFFSTFENAREFMLEESEKSVSYTHLTLPTKA